MRENAEQAALRDAVRALIAAHQAQADGDDDDLRLWGRLCAEIGVAGRRGASNEGSRPGTALFDS